LVSGKNTKKKKKPAILNKPKNTKLNTGPILNIYGETNTTKKVESHSTAEVNAIALPLISLGYISEISTQTTGPSVKANEPIYNITRISI
jgi:hypothetical protein